MICHILRPYKIFISRVAEPIIVIYYTSGVNECLTSDAFNSASGEAVSALTSQVKHSFSPRVYYNCLSNFTLINLFNFGEVSVPVETVFHRVSLVVDIYDYY
jgi:hypothetical protein